MPRHGTSRNPVPPQKPMKKPKAGTQPMKDPLLVIRFRGRANLAPWLRIANELSAIELDHEQAIIIIAKVLQRIRK